MPTDPPERLERDELASLRRWCERSSDPRIQAFADRVRDVAEACLDWHRAKGHRHVDWVATTRTWIRNAVRYSAERAGPLPRGPTKHDRLPSQHVNEIWADELAALEEKPP